MDETKLAGRKSFFAALLLCRVCPEDPSQYQCLVVPQYVDTLHPRGVGIPVEKRLWALRSNGATLQTKFPGGTEKFLGETPPEIAMRELLEETGAILILDKPLGKENVVLRVPKGKDHTQYFFFIPPGMGRLEGELRTKPILDDTGREDEILLPPIWVTVSDLRKMIYSSHAQALEDAGQFI